MVAHLAGPDDDDFHIDPFLRFIEAPSIRRDAAGNLPFVSHGQNLASGRPRMVPEKVQPRPDLVRMVRLRRDLQPDGGELLRLAGKTVEESRDQGFDHLRKFQKAPAGGWYGERQVACLDAADRPRHLVAGVVEPVVGEFGSRPQTEEEQAGGFDALREGIEQFLQVISGDPAPGDGRGDHSVEPPVHQAAESSGRPFIGEETENQGVTAQRVRRGRRYLDLHLCCAAFRRGRPESR